MIEAPEAKKTAIPGEKNIIKSYLPKLLLDQLKLLFPDPKDLKVVIKAVSIFYTKYVIEKIEFSEFLLFTKAYKKKLVNNNSANYKFYNVLYRNEILQKYSYSDGTTFSKNKGHGSKSRLNAKYLKGELVPVRFELKSNYKRSQESVKPYDNVLKINLGKVKPIYKDDNEILFHIRKQKETIKAEIDSKIYITSTGKLRFKANQRAPPITILEDKELFIEDKYVELEGRYRILLHMAFSNAFDPKRNPTNYRLDYFLTTFPTRFQHLLQFDGEPFREIDLCNSQLTILFNLLDQVCLGSGNLLNLKEEVIYNNLLNLKEGVIYNNLLKEGNKANTYYCSDFFWKLYEESDVLHFKDLVYKGAIYDELVKYSLKDGKLVTRNQIKSQIFALIFGKYKSYTVNKSNFLNENFPNVHRLFILIKKRFESLIKDNTILPIKSRRMYINELRDDFSYVYGNNYLSITLQRLESEIFIDHLLPVMYSKNICCLPKHDSILMPESAKEMVKTTMDYELSKFFGNNFVTK